jgi:hypothetical protein
MTLYDMAGNRYSPYFVGLIVISEYDQEQGPDAVCIIFK